MQALVFEQTGEPLEVLALADVPMSQADPGEVLVRVNVRPIQPADSLFIAGRYRVQPRFPQIAGFDGAGVVVGHGTGVNTPAVGTRVAFRSPGVWAEYAAIPAYFVYPVPEDLSASINDTSASQFALNPLTAWGLLHTLNLCNDESTGKRVLATAGRSMVVGLFAHLAERRGIVVERLVRDAGRYRLLDASGEHALAQGDDPADALAKIAPYDAVIDAVGGPGTLAVIDAIVSGGTLVSYGVLDSRPFEMRAATMLFRNLSWHGFGIAGWLSDSEQSVIARAQRECWEMLARRPDLLPVVGRFPLGDFRMALRKAQESQGQGKVLLV